MKTVKKQFLSASLMMLVISASNVHGRAIENADTANAEAVSINSTSPQSGLSASGRVAITLREDPSGRARVTAIPGVRITFTRVSGTGPVPSPALTDENGNWSQSGFVPFEARGLDSAPILYRATPSKFPLAFGPAFLTFSANKLVSPVANLNFEARNDSVVVSGRVVTDLGKPVPGVTVSVEQDRQLWTTTTDSQGRWFLVVLGNFSTLYAVPSFQHAFISFDETRFRPSFRAFTRMNSSSLPYFEVQDQFTVRGRVDSRRQGTEPPVTYATLSVELISGTGCGPLEQWHWLPDGSFVQSRLTTGCTYRVKALTRSGVKCNPVGGRDVKGEVEIPSFQCP